MSRIPSQTFRRLCAQFATGISVVTVLDEDGSPHGVTVNSFTSVSLEPPLVLICIDRSCNLMNLFQRDRHYGINVLHETQREVACRFAQRGQDRFDGLLWQQGQTRVPLIPGALAHFECRIDQVVEAGDHTILIAEVVHGGTGQGRPLLFFDSDYRKLG